jgi:hypothetical protein
MKNDFNFNDVKNKFRGIVASYKSKKFIKDKTLTDSAVFKQNIKSLLVECRTNFAQANFDEVIRWINAGVKTQAPELHQKKIGFEDLRFIKPEVKDVTISTNIQWIASRLSEESKNINTFISLKSEIEDFILRGKYTKALKALDYMEQSIGATLWSVKLKVSLLHTSKGLEAQKQYTNEVRNVWSGGILSYITLFTSVRNEDRTTISKFSDDMEQKFKNSNANDDIIPHLRYHLLAELPSSEKDASDLLLMEQLGTIYDLYEAFLSITLESYNSSRFNIDETILADSIKKIHNVKDPRLSKFIFLKNGRIENNVVEQRHYLVSDEIIDENSNSKLIAYKKFRSNSIHYLNVWNHIYVGFWLSLQGRSYKIKNNAPHLLPLLIGKALSEGAMLNDVKSLLKLSVNYHALPLFKGINEFLNILIKHRSEFHDSWSLRSIGLHSSTIGVEDYPLNVNRELLSHFQPSLVKSLWLGDTQNKRIQGLTSTLFDGLRHLENFEYEKCLSRLPTRIDSRIPLPHRMIFVQMKLFALSKENSKPDIIRLINDTAPESFDIIDIVLFENELIHYVYEDFECDSNVLAAPIALFVTWFKTEDSKLLSYLRVSTKQAIKNLGLQRPSQINENLELFTNAQLKFFLNYICVPQVIDNIRALRGTKAVLNERQNICRRLVQLDPANSAEYSAEIESIDDDLLMEAGKRVVDRTRIYVDMDAHSRWMLKELEEDYERYKDLQEIKITGEQNYSEIVDEFLNSGGATKTTFQPENEADAVLLSLVAKASNDFLTNPKYGLDYFLSKRIRHQSFIGLIRSHLEFSNLITTRVTKSDKFEYNHHWVDKFTTLTQGEKDQLNSLLSGFAEDFDNLLIHVRDNIFQLNTEDCPTGLIKIDFNIHVMSLLKHFILETNASFEHFVYYSNIFMWVFLQPSLEKTKSYIQSSLKPKIMHSADNLKAHARKLAGADPSFDEFELQLTDKIASVQRSLEDVMSWFTPLTGVSAETVVISVDKALSLSTKAALEMLRPFEPKIATSIDNAIDLKLQQQGLTFLNDTIFILFDNIKTHSGLKYPEINLEIIVNSNDETITIKCVNNTRQTDRVRLKHEIDKIRALIDNGKIGDRARLEGRSGFIKLAASIDKAINGHLDFDLLDSGEFALTIKNDLTIKLIPSDEVRFDNV